MFEIMMQSGGHRVVYLNHSAIGEDDAFGFYVCGRILDNQRYSFEARHHLLAGLQWITCTMQLEKLIAVYIDVASMADLDRPGRRQLFYDIENGMFKKVLVYQKEDLMDGISENKNMSFLPSRNKFATITIENHCNTSSKQMCIVNN
jgi:hypothetical protein